MNSTFHAGSVAAVIPALDEEMSVGAVIRAIDRRVVGVVIVGDNGSSDRTAEVAREAGATVVPAPDRGYGAACAAALRALPSEVGIIVFLDADGADDPSQIASLIGPILEGRADLVIGSRALGYVEPGALTPQQRAGNWLATRLIHLLHGFRYTDLGPFRAIRRELLDAIGMRDRRYGWTVEMQIRALQIGGRIVEVPAACRKRVGVSKISGTIKGVALAGYWILFTIAKCSFFPPASGTEASAKEGAWRRSVGVGRNQA